MLSSVGDSQLAVHHQLLLLSLWRRYVGPMTPELVEQILEKVRHPALGAAVLHVLLSPGCRVVAASPYCCWPDWKHVVG